jgi:hypothetical protein
MAKKTTKQEPKIELFRGIWTLPKDFPDDKLELLNERYETTEKWEAKRRKQGGAFNEQFCADIYTIASLMTKDDSFKGKFNPEELYTEMCETMTEMRKGKKEYSLNDEVKMLSKVMDKHKKKTATKK